MKFKAINDPRTKNGEFGKQRCHRCGCKSTAYLKIEFKDHRLSVVLCKGCLLEGVEIINNTMLEDCIKKGKNK